jgi:hypothetical protein
MDAPGGRALNAIYFCVGDRTRNVCGYTWKLWWHETTFYAKARGAPLAGIKLSLHGQDVRSGMTARRPGFKVDLDRDALPTVKASNGTIALFDMSLPTWFAGMPVRKTGATHVLRFRTTWESFASDVPSAPIPGNVKAGNFAGIVPLPKPFAAVDLDVFVSKIGPYWPQEKQTRRDNACLGPLRSKAGECLTARVVNRSVLTSPTPPDLVNGLSAVDAADKVRGIGMQLDVHHGFLWIHERILSRSALAAASQLP